MKRLMLILTLGLIPLISFSQWQKIGIPNAYTSGDFGSQGDITVSDTIWFDGENVYITTKNSNDTLVFNKIIEAENYEGLWRGLDTSYFLDTMTAIQSSLEASLKDTIYAYEIDSALIRRTELGDTATAIRADYFTNLDETDPIYSTDPASSITSAGSGSVITSTERNHFSATDNPHSVTLQQATTAGNTTDQDINITNGNLIINEGSSNYHYFRLYRTNNSGEKYRITNFLSSDGTGNIFLKDETNSVNKGRIAFETNSNLSLKNGNVNITDGVLQVAGTGTSSFAGTIALQDQNNNDLYLWSDSDNRRGIISCNFSIALIADDINSTSSDRKIIFGARDKSTVGGDYIEYGRFDNGRFGIGTDPSEALDVSGNIKTTGRVEFIESDQSGSGTITFDLSTSAVHEATLTGDATLDYSNAATGTYIIKITQDGTGGRTISWASSSWQATGGSVTIDTDANATTILSCFYDIDASRMIITEIENLQDL